MFNSPLGIPQGVVHILNGVDTEAQISQRSCEFAVGRELFVRNCARIIRGANADMEILLGIKCGGAEDYCETPQGEAS